jgi:hypothetical protein
MRSLRCSAAALAALVLLASCREMNAPVVQSAVRSMPDVMASLSRSGSASVSVVERDKAIGEGVRAAKTIDARGGSIELPAAGFTLVIPAGAVTKATAFSVTAVPGKVVAYEFEPHGTAFNTPVLGLQSLAGLRAKGGKVDVTSLFVGYFHDRSEVGSLFATVHEVFSLKADTEGRAVVAIPHFSGYIFASGRGAEREED